MGKGILSFKKEEGKKLWNTFRLASSCFGSRKDPTKFVYLAVSFFAQTGYSDEQKSV